MEPKPQQDDNAVDDNAAGDNAVNEYEAEAPLHADTDAEALANGEAEADQLSPEHEAPQYSAEEFLAMKDRMLRALAEAENVRRRAQREVAEAKTYGVTQFARDMLAVQDNLSRALDAIDGETQTPDESAVKAFVEGVELTGKELENTLERHGVKQIETDGTKFDPNYHQALFEVESDEAPGTIVQTLQTGYAIGERTLRPAMVGVAKAKKTPAPEETPPE